MGSKKRKILIIVQTLSNGGVEKVASIIANNLNSEVKIILYENKVIYKNNLKKIILDSPPSSNYLFKFIRFIKRVWSVRKIKNTENPDYVISFSDGPNLVNILSKTKEKVIISIHSNKSNTKGEGKIVHFIYHLFYKKFYNKADSIVCVSKGVRDDLINNFNISTNKTTVIYNPIDFNEIREKEKERIENYLKPVFNNKVIITAGRLTEVKGQWHLIRSFRKIKEKIPNSKLVLLGDGELKEYLIKLSKNLGLKVYSSWADDKNKAKNADVLFLGFVKNPFKYFKNSYLFTLPSLCEGFGVVITEAAACSLPVVSSDCNSGPREILAPNTDLNQKIKKTEFADFGILIPVSSGVMYKSNHLLTEIENQWSEIINNLLLEDKENIKKYKEASIKRAKDFSIDVIIQKWEKLLNNV